MHVVEQVVSEARRDMPTSRATPAQWAEIRHPRLVFGLVAVDGGIPGIIDDGARFFQPLVDPLAAHLVADVREVGSDHRRRLDAGQAMATHAIEFRQQLTALGQPGRLGKVGLMADAARGLDITSGQEWLLPRQRGFVGLSDLGGGTLAAMAHHASPFLHAVRNRRMGAKGLRHGSVGEARLGHARVASGATVDHIHLGNPNLFDSGLIIGQQTLGVRPCLRETSVLALIAFPWLEEIPGGRNGQHRDKDERGKGKRRAHAPRHYAHVFGFRRHTASTARPMTSPGLGRKSPPPSR